MSTRTAIINAEIAQWGRTAYNTGHGLYNYDNGYTGHATLDAINSADAALNSNAYLEAVNTALTEAAAVGSPTPYEPSEPISPDNPGPPPVSNVGLPKSPIHFQMHSY
ncbi:MAG: hypothetical protein MK052_03905 [Alphaproteobacteria bacterium]|nr:hypothetical protein [Alphaproteobacteria bacterium]